MSRATSDDQLKFLVSCVKHANNGKIDFVEVAQECGVVSKGAAAKRYERLMKANGINPNGGPDPKPLPPSTPKAPKNKPRNDSHEPRAKRRKMNNAAEKKQDEASTALMAKPEPPGKMKMEESGPPTAETLPVTTQPITLPATIPPTTTLLVTTNQDIHRKPVQHDESTFDFDEFCSPEMFAQCTSETSHPSHESGTLDSLATSASHVPSSASSPIQGMPQPVGEDVKREKKVERETVVIAD